MVRVTGLEPAFLLEVAPKTTVSADFTTPAYLILLSILTADSGQFYNSNDVARTKSNVSANFTTPAY